MSNKAKAKSDEQFTKALDEMLTVRAAIDVQTGKQRNVQGEIDCPVCGFGRVRYAVNHNGTMRARCTTPMCVQWVE